MGVDIALYCLSDSPQGSSKWFGLLWLAENIHNKSLANDMNIAKQNSAIESLCPGKSSGSMQIQGATRPRAEQYECDGSLVSNNKPSNQP